MLSTIIVVFGLIVFEIISSIDNAIVNAHVLKTMPEKFRKFFLLWGMFFAVFVVRGILPFLIVWMVNPALSIAQVWTFVFSNDPQILAYVEQTRPILMIGGGVYLFFIFLSWLFLEEKKYAFFVEHFIHRRSAWFYAISSIFLTTIVYVTLKINPVLAFSAMIGSTAFFITDGFKKNAEEQEKNLASSNMSAWSKIMYLEVLDASFSIDGVIGAFAFTVSVPLILLGNGIGAFVVRELTLRGMGVITRLAYLKNGAMYSVGVLGAIMVLESLGQHYPFWFAPLNTTILLGIFLFLSYREMRLSTLAVEAKIA